jgi:hypothetical protein
MDERLEEFLKLLGDRSPPRIHELGQPAECLSFWCSDPSLRYAFNNRNT